MDSKILDHNRDASDSVFGVLPPDRFEARFMSLDWGIYDIETNEFIGKPITGYKHASIACDWFNDLYKAGMLKLKS